MASIARESWADPKALYALFDEAYPQPKDGSRRKAPFLPYLALVPPDFALSLNFAGGGMFANGKFIDSIGWGTGVTLDKVWLTGLNGAIGVMDFNGRPIGNETDFPFADKVGGLQGVGVARNGDVWIADATKHQMLYFPGGRVKDERLVQVAGLKSPFGVAIDAQNRVWVSNAQSDN